MFAICLQTKKIENKIVCYNYNWLIVIIFNYKFYSIYKGDEIMSILK